MAKRTDKKSKVLSTSKWACLPHDILLSILYKSGLSDYVRFSAVCRSWNSVALSLIRHNKDKLKQLSTQQPPWLMATTRVWVWETRNRQPGIRDFLSKNKIGLRDFSNPQISNKFNLRIKYQFKQKECCGSSHGWLIFFMKRKSQIVVLNPFSGTNIRLPPVMVDGGQAKSVTRVILSREPSLGSSFEVLAIWKSLQGGIVLGHLKFDEQVWTHTQNSAIISRYNGFTFHKGRILCASEGTILSLILVANSSHGSSSSSPRSIEAIEEVASSIPDDLLARCWFHSFFAESKNGDLLVVHKTIGHETNVRAYYILKIVDLDGKLGCIPVMNLDGQSLFLDKNQAISVLALNYPGCRPNSIYYLDDDDSCSIAEFNTEDPIVVGDLERFAKPIKDRPVHVSWILPSMKLPKKALLN